jgi:hypothetical protein
LTVPSLPSRASTRKPPVAVVFTGTITELRPVMTGEP